MAIKTVKLAADFETTTDPSDVRVWAACAVDIDTLETAYIGNSIDSFFDYLRDKNSVVYFHNLKFDGEFILHYLLSHGYRHTNDRKDIKAGVFQSLITDDGLFYSIEVYFEVKNKKYRKAKFLDSLKKLPFKVSQISKAFKLEDEKLEIDYKAYRAPGHELTEEEKRYIVNDCRIVAAALRIQFSQGLKKMTNASDAMNWYKGIDKRKFDYLFPSFPFDLDKDIRQAYRGGFVYLKPEHKNRRGLEGITLDVNSLYPWAMYTGLLPCRFPVYFEGKPQPTEDYPLFICRINCTFKVKPGYLPTIQLKNSGRFASTEYITDSGPEPVDLTLTSVDLALFLDHYETGPIDYQSGFYFRGQRGIFKEYIDHWMHIKETSTGAIRQLAKLMLNSLYGKFASATRGKKKLPFLDSDGTVRYHLSEYEYRDAVYTPMACFITAYAREKTIRSAQSVYDRFIYADTDSLHLIGTDIPEGLEVHPTKLGAWAHEGTFTDSKYLRAKTYMETIDGVNKVTCAGMPDNVKEKVDYENFKPGTTFDGKLMPRRFPGGIVLVETTFTIS